MKDKILQASVVVGGLTGTNATTGYLANQAGYEAGLSKVEVVAEDNIAAGGNAKEIVAILKAAGKQAEVEQYSNVGARGYWGNLWAAIWGN